MNLRIHRLLAESRANGPGRRAVLWTQGCTLGCAGCFNAETHAVAGGIEIAVRELADEIRALPIEGVTISGGEPLQQRAALTELLRCLKAETALSVIVFSGFTWNEIQRMERPAGGASSELADAFAPAARQDPARTPARRFRPEFLNYVDVLIAGRFDATRRLASGLRGSANKTVHFCSDRYTTADLGNVPDAELIISADGEIILSGIDPLRF